MFTFATDYYIGVFISAMGALQLAASLGGLKGLLFLKSPIVSRTLALALVVAGFVLFFSTGSRNINDYEGGLDAPTQGLFFFLGASTAVLVTLAVSSLVNYRMRGDESEPSGGVESLRDTNYALALARSIAYWCKNWRTQTKRYFSE